MKLITTTIQSMKRFKRQRRQDLNIIVALDPSPWIKKVSQDRVNAGKLNPGNILLRGFLCHIKYLTGLE